jgi:hypothetical protein
MNWVIPLIYLYIAASIGYAGFAFLEYRDKQKRNATVASIYEFKIRNGRFPSASEVKQASKRKYNYIPDSSYNYFTLYCRDLYGFPVTFTSIDSIWKRN